MHANIHIKRNATLNIEKRYLKNINLRRSADGMTIYIEPKNCVRKVRVTQSIEQFIVKCVIKRKSKFTLQVKKQALNLSMPNRICNRIQQKKMKTSLKCNELIHLFFFLPILFLHHLLLLLLILILGFFLLLLLFNVDVCSI